MINRKQFVISDKAYYARDFVNIKINKKFIISYHKELNVRIIDSDRCILLIGDAWQTDSDRMSPYNELERLTKEKDDFTVEEICDMENSWCGRYLLIVQNKIYMDAIGSLGLFYSDVAISSSCSLLCDILGIKDKYIDKTFGIALGFQPGTLTMHKRIRRLLPSQIYDFEKRELLYRKLLLDGYFEKYDTDKVMMEFVKTFKYSLKNLRNEFEGEIWLALTGGHDSRTLVALMEYAEIPYNCFTLEVDNMTKGDRELSYKIAEKLGRKYEFIKRRKYRFSVRRFFEYITHSNGFAKDQDVWSYAYGQYQKLTEFSDNIIVLRSQVWEIFIKYFRRYTDESGMLNLDVMKKRNILLEADKLSTDSLSEYFDYIRAHEEKGLEEVNRYYWEIRDGCWLSSIEQSCDIMDNMIFFQPCNSRKILSMLMILAKDEQEPWKKNHQKRIIEKCCNILTTIEFDSDYDKNKKNSGLISNIQNKIRLCIYTILLYGIKGTILPRQIMAKTKK